MKFFRALTGSLVPWLTVACISGADVAAPVTASSSSAGGKSSANGQGGAIAGNIGGTKAVAGATGGKSNAGVGGSQAVSSTAANVGGTQAVNVGGQSTSTSTGAGGIAATGGTPTTAAPPTGNLGVYLPQDGAITGSQSLTIHVDIVNTSSTTQDLSTVTMRYWYVDDGWGSAQLILATEYVSIGYSNTGTVTYVGSTAVSPAQTGADHYVEFSFTGTLAAVNNINSNDKFHVQVALHAPGYAGSANVANDYSVMTTTGYDDKITLYSSGTLIWGTEPGGSTAAGGSGGASGVGGAGTMGGATSPASTTTGGGVGTSGVVGTGGAVSTGGGVGTGGVSGLGGDSSAGGIAGTGGDSDTGGDAGTDWDASTGGDMSIGGNSSIGST